ncbi:MAG TPA: ParB/RepB/Spo0J family partition protein [candidate division Zixibacteria bacterium]|nr:ParB/RepB/Spo0J family partition protein [candidate division Zixibacteria bacterium]
MSKLVLGKGLGALIPADDTQTAESRRLKTISLDRIAPNPMQPRREFDQESLMQLAQSFKENGIMQPLLVRPNGSGFTIIAGERRYRAARLAGMTEVPVLQMDDVSDTQMLAMALVENLQRENLNPMETAEGYRRLIEECGLTQAQLGDRVGRSRSAVTNMLRLNTLPDSIKSMIRLGKLTEGHARAILALDNEVEMVKLAEQIVSDSMSVREVEHVTSRTKKRRLIPKKKIPALTEIENYLKRLLGTSVKINPGLKQGRIEIEYYGDDDLERLLELFKKIES